MDRSGQLRNVAFGGAWSEQIAGRERLAEALARLREAAQAADLEDLRIDRDLPAALDLACAAHPKGLLLQLAWTKAADLTDPGTRQAELLRIARLLEDAVRARL